MNLINEIFSYTLYLRYINVKLYRFQETIKFIHLSDIHIDLFYNTSAAGSDCGQPLCCREENGIVGANSSGYWGDRECGLPIWSFRDMPLPLSPT